MSEHAPSFNGMVDALNAPFYLNGFFFAAGYLYIHREGFGDFVKRKAKQLLIPWAFFSLFIILSAQIVSFNAHDDLKTSLANNLLQIRLQGDEMWFVAALFVCFIPFYFLIKWFISAPAKSRKTIIATVFILFVLSKIFYTLGETEYIGGRSHRYIWHLEYIPRGLFLMFLGYLFRMRWEKTFDEKNTLIFRIFFWAGYLALAIVPQLTHHVFSMHGRIAYRYISSFIGMTAVISLAKTVKPNRYMRFVGENTITFYGLHGKLQSVLGQVLYRLLGQTYATICWGFEYSTAVLFAGTALAYGFALFSSVVLIVPAFLLLKYTPVLVGKPPRKKTERR